MKVYRIKNVTLERGISRPAGVVPPLMPVIGGRPLPPRASRRITEQEISLSVAQDILKGMANTSLRVSPWYGPIKWMTAEQFREEMGVPEPAPVVVKAIAVEPEPPELEPEMEPAPEPPELEPEPEPSEEGGEAAPKVAAPDDLLEPEPEPEPDPETPVVFDEAELRKMKNAELDELLVTERGWDPSQLYKVPKKDDKVAALLEAEED